MLSSLRFRLPALFLAGIAAAGIVSVVLAFTLLQSYSRSQSLKELRREAAGLTGLYEQQYVQSLTQGTSVPAYLLPQIQKATNDLICYAGTPLFPGQKSEFCQLPGSSRLIDWRRIRAGKTDTFEFTPARESHPFIAVANPVEDPNTRATLGALIVAKTKTELRATWVTLMKFFSVSLLGGAIVAGVLAWYTARRIARPLRGLSRAADAIADGRYDVDVPRVPSGDEIGHLAERFQEMAMRLGEAEALERNFLMSVSHELRTPLTAIRGHAEALREGLAEDPETRAESIAVIAAETERLERLVGDVLDLAKLDAHRFTLHREEVDMGELLDHVYASFGEEARRREIEYHCDVRDRPVIVTDGDRVLQIVSNLLSNAFRWTPNGGRIELGLAAGNGAVEVTVGDTGPGIRPEDRERIFRPFWSKDTKGTGLGLPIARELASALGGRIDLDSAPGEGSRFALRLPTRSGE